MTDFQSLYNAMYLVLGDPLADDASPTEIAERVEKVRSIQDFLTSYLIHEVGKKFIPNFHWMDHVISTFWDCDESPIGVCVFSREFAEHRVIMGDCIYCHQPQERK